MNCNSLTGIQIIFNYQQRVRRYRQILQNGNISGFVNYRLVRNKQVVVVAFVVS